MRGLEILLVASIAACTPTSAPAPIPPTSPAPQPFRASVIVRKDPHCIAVDLEAWRDALEHAHPYARAKLLTNIGLVLDDDSDGDTDPHLDLYLRKVQIHDVELGGPPGIERIVEVELADNAQLDDTHVHAVMQVFTHGHAGKATGESTQAVSEYSLSYLSLDEQGHVTRIFGPFPLHHERVVGDSGSHVIGELTIDSKDWPHDLQTTEDHVSWVSDTLVSEHLRTTATWVLRDGGVYEAWRRSSFDPHAGPDCVILGHQGSAPQP